MAIICARVLRLAVTCISLFVIFSFGSVAFDSRPSADLSYQFYNGRLTWKYVYCIENGLICISSVKLAGCLVQRWPDKRDST